jgi:hypothetical protein
MWICVTILHVVLYKSHVTFCQNKKQKISFHLTLITILPQVMSFSLQGAIILIKAKPNVKFDLILCFWVLNNLIMKMINLFT